MLKLSGARKGVEREWESRNQVGMEKQSISRCLVMLKIG